MDPLVQSIILNFSTEFDKFKSKDPSSKILEYFNSKNVKSPGVLKGFANSVVIATTTNTKGNGYAVVQYDNKTFYIGQLLDGKKSGFGVRSYVGSALAYVGDYQNDIKAGQGKLFDFKKNKIVFTGEWARDKRNGYGELEKDNAFYKGNYVEDQMDGKGKQLWENGDSYEGDFKNDLKNGRGLMKHANGDVYEGQFVNGKMHGEGVYTWKNGEKYIGEFRDGTMGGRGKIDYGINVVAEGIFEGNTNRNVGYGLTGEFGKY
jgi:hypothetical protein